MTNTEKTITIPRKYVYWWICLTVVAMICFVSGWMLANYGQFTTNTQNNEQTTTTQERNDILLYGGMTYATGGNN